MRTAAEIIAGLIDGKKDVPGPFCSELVQIVFTALGKILPTRSGDPATRAPADYAAADEFEQLEGEGCLVIIAGSQDDLPGKPCNDDTFVSQIDRMLTSTVLRNPEMEGKILQLNARLAELVPWLNGTNVDEERRACAERALGYRTSWLQQIDEFLRIGPDRFWGWVESANECRPDCQDNKRAHGHVVNWPPPERTFSEQFLEQATVPEWKRSRYWNGEACIDVRKCSCAEAPGNRCALITTMR